MDIISNSLLPIESLAGLLTGNTMQGLSGSTGCPDTKKCSGCIPFCCYPSVDPQNYIIKNDVAQYWSLSKTLLFSLIPCGKIGSIAFDLLSYITNYVNSAINKKRNIDEQKAIINSSMEFMGYYMQGKLDCRIGWCRTLSHIAGSRDFAPNSPVFGDKGPSVMLEAMKIYIKAANEANNNRYGKTTQTILDVAASYDNDLPINEIEARRLMIKVSNIEHYWQGDVILVPNPTAGVQFGSTTELLVKHRSGYSKEYTPDCDMEVIDKTIVPSGIYDGKRGCQSGIDASFHGHMQSLGSANSGLNIRNLVGEGWLVSEKSIDYFSAAFLSNLKGKKVSLKNPVYVIMDPAKQNPPKQTPIPAPTIKPPASVPPATNPVTSLLKLDSSLFSKLNVASISSGILNLGLLCVGITFLYEAFVDEKPKPKAATSNKPSDNQ
ncbi:MAG: hypothetical protein NTY96_00295 [Bacteroidetes bacterium]|nr:hypothetical protein [Bacteroidota bacterium]